MGIIGLISIIFILLGIHKMLDEDKSSFVWLILGLALPLVVSVTLYPIYALANIDENIRMLNEKLDTIVSNVLPDTSKNGKKELPPQNITSSNNTPTNEQQNNKTIPTVKAQDAIDFINKKYGIDISIDDNLDNIKFKVLQISDSSSSIRILIQKISNATDIETVIEAFILHKVAHS